jgi:hypothetical protein
MNPPTPPAPKIACRMVLNDAIESASILTAVCLFGNRGV